MSSRSTSQVLIAHTVHEANPNPNPNPHPHPHPNPNQVLIAHTVHEATHGNLSTDPRVNYWLQFTYATRAHASTPRHAGRPRGRLALLLTRLRIYICIYMSICLLALGRSHPICFNVFVWIPQHLLSHHQYTNDYRHGLTPTPVPPPNPDPYPQPQPLTPTPNNNPNP